MLSLYKTGEHNEEEGAVASEALYGAASNAAETEAVQVQEEDLEEAEKVFEFSWPGH